MIFNKLDRIVFAGDSITDMGSTNPVGEGLFENLGRSYVHVIENLLYVFYPEIPVRITNSGISGNTSRDLLERWERDVLSLNPDYVSICIGVNDVWRQFDLPAFPDLAVKPQEYEKNVREMILRTKDRVKKIFILSPYYMEPNTADKMRARMDEYRKICKELSEKYGCEYVDLQEMFDRFFRHYHSSLIAWDRVHPNQIGATLIAREFLKHCDFDYNHSDIKG